MSPRSSTLRTLRVIAFVALGLFGLVALVVVLLLLPPVRKQVLSAALDRARDALPGTLEIGDTSWPSLGRLELTDVVWTIERSQVRRQAGNDPASEDPGDSGDGNGGGDGDGDGDGAGDGVGVGVGVGVGDEDRPASGDAPPRTAAGGVDSGAGPDTLLAADRIAVAIRLPALLNSDVRLRELTGDAVRVDVPGLQAAFAPADTTTPPPPAGQGGGFPRMGSFEPIPSVAVDSLRLDAPRVVLTDSLVVEDALIDARIDLSHGRTPTVRFDRATLRLHAEGSPMDVRLDHLESSIELPGTVQLRGNALWNDTLHVALILDGIVVEDTGSLDLQLGIVPEPRDPSAATADWAFLRTRADVTFPDKIEDALASGGALEISELETRTIQLRGRFGVPPLREATGLFPAEGTEPSELPRVPALAGSLRADYDGFGRRTSASLRLDTNDWIEELHVRVLHRGDTLSVDTLRASLPGIQVRGSARQVSESIVSQLRVHVTSLDFLRRIELDAPAFQTLDVTAEIEASGPMSSPELNARVRGELEQESFHIQELDLHAAMPADSTGRAHVALFARTPQAVVHTRVEAPGVSVSHMESPWSVQVAPVVLRVPDAPTTVPPSVLGPNPGSVRIDTSTGNEAGAVRVQASALRVDGDAGELQIDGTWSEASGADARVQARWPDPPELLLDRIEAAPALLDTLRARWEASDPFHVDLQVATEPMPAGLRIGAEGDIYLPGPRHLAAALPGDPSQWADLGAIQGFLDLRRSADEELSLRLDLSETAWMEQALVRVQGGPDVYTVDSTRIAFEGVDLRASGRAGPELLDLQIEAEVENAELARRFVDLRASGAPDDTLEDGTAARTVPTDPISLQNLDPLVGPDSLSTLETRGLLSASITGTPETPQGQLSFEGRFRGFGVEVPSILLEASLESSDARLHLSAPEGLQRQDLELDSAELTYETSSPFRNAPQNTAPDAVPGFADRILPGRLALSALGPRIGVENEVRISAPGDTTDWRFQFDELVLRYEVEEVHSAEPFQIDLTTEPLRIVVSDLRLRGSMGSASIDGHAGRGATDLTVDVELDLPDEPLMAAWPSEVWPDRVDLDLRAFEDSLARTAPRIDVSGRLAGLQIPDRDGERTVDLRFDVLGADSLVTLTTFVGAEGDSVLHIDAEIPADFSFFPAQARPLPGQLQLDGKLHEMPIPLRYLQTRSGPLWSRDRVLVSGDLRGGGTARNPALHATFQLNAPGKDELARYRIDLEALIETEAPTQDRALVADPTGPLSRADVKRSAPGLLVALEISKKDRRVAHARAQLPIVTSVTSGNERVNFTIEAGDSLDAALEIDRLALSDFNPLLPPDTQVEGTLDLNAEAAGLLENPRLDGRLQAVGLEARSADGSWVAGEADIEFRGTRNAPEADGRLEIQAGVIRLPEAGKNLHPTEGQSLLLQSYRRTARLDSLRQAPGRPDSLVVQGRAGGTITPSDMDAYVSEVDDPFSGADSVALTRVFSGADTLRLPGTPDSAEAEPGAAADTAPVEDTSRADSAAPGTAASDTTAARAGDLTSDMAGPPIRAARFRPRDVFRPQFDVQVTIPSGLWIRGRGLDAELSGDLRLEQSNSLLPTVTGVLEVVRGTFVFLGRSFDLEVGRVAFYGEDELDPSLDIQLTTEVQDVLIRIILSGSAENPDLSLTSEPPYAEGDIFSLLLFGRTTNELDTGQVELVQDRAAEIAASYTSAALGQRLSRELGVDLVAIQTGSGPGAQQSLVIGKYISRRILLKYEQALNNVSGVFLNLEYLLTRRLKIETHFGFDSQSGAEINWGVDY